MYHVLRTAFLLETELNLIFYFSYVNASINFFDITGQALHLHIQHLSLRTPTMH